MHASELWHSPAFGPRALRTLLTPVSWLYAAGWQSYLGVYRLGLKRAKEAHRPVLCVGNLTVGGAGKTPLTIHIYDVLKDLGREPLLSVSGYGSPRAEAATLAPQGDLKASEWGDEAAMIRWLRPSATLIVGRRRVRAADIVHEKFPDVPLLMDDGFQHLPLRKHLSVVLDEPSPANGRCLPAGPYREPRSNRSRADLVLPGKFQVVDHFLGVFEPAGEKAEAHDVQVLCALGRPDRFLDAIRGNGMRIAHAKALPDHDPLSAGTLFEGLNPELPVVVTAKDWVKLRERSDLVSRNILIARHEVEVQPAAEFRKLLHATLTQVS